jgi:hypothetical protein
MQNLNLRKIFGLLGDEFERVLLGVLVLTVGLLLFSGIQDDNLHPPQVATKYTPPEYFDDAVAWLFIDPMANPAMGDDHAFKTRFPDGWKPNVRATVTNPTDPPKIEDPIANPNPNPNGGDPVIGTGNPPPQLDPDPKLVTIEPEPPPVKPPPVKPPTEPPPPPPAPKNYLSFKGFVKSSNNHTMAFLVQEQGGSQTPAYLELGHRFQGMLVVAVDKYRIVLQRPNGERLTLNSGERVELRDQDLRRKNSP